MIKQSEVGRVEPLLVDIWREGKLVYNLPTFEEIRAQRRYDLEHLNEGVKRLLNPHVYHVSLTANLWELKQRLIQEALEQNS
jgi:nicotinate phosphoribosyltransferase